MASLRSLKKDIDYLLSLVLEECMYVIEAYPDAEKEKVWETMRKVIAGHRELRLRVNHLNGKDNPKVVKEYLRQVVQDLYKTANSALEELSGFTKQP
jgi:hypothetical protein